MWKFLAACHLENNDNDNEDHDYADDNINDYDDQDQDLVRTPGDGNAETTGIVIKSRATSHTIWRQPGAIVWTKLIPAGNLASSH